MPVGYSSVARNLFLLGASGADAVVNFFKSVDKSPAIAFSEGQFNPTGGIKYDQDKYLISGQALGSDSFVWIDKRGYDPETSASTSDWENRRYPTVYSSYMSLTDMELDSNSNVIAVGKVGGVGGDYGAETCWIAKYSNAGVLQWQSTSNTGDLEYTGVTSDSNGNYYACGHTPDSGEAVAFVEKFDAAGNPDWGKAAHMLGRDVVLKKISANSRGEVVAVGYLEDDTIDKGYIVKIDTSTGKILWDRTLERSITGSAGTIPADVRCTACYIDSNDQIYVVGTVNGNNPVNNGVGEFLIKYTAEGNIVWQRENNTDQWMALDGDPNVVPFDVWSDGETEQTVVLSVWDRGSFALNDSDIFISKYNRNGDIVFRRKISKGGDNLGTAGLDGDTSYYYVVFRDERVQGIDPERYTFGKVSISGNGLGTFNYDDGTGDTNFNGTDKTVDYIAISNPENKIGKMSDGSVRNDSSDLMTYPFSSNKLLFDDLATHVSNKRRQMDSADSFEYSGSPAIRVVDFQELNLLGDVAPIPGTTTTTSTTITETWSSYVSNGSTGDRAPSKAFNGSIANNTGYSETNWTRSASNGNTPAVLDVSSIVLMGSVTEVKVYAYVADSQNNGTILAVNDVNQATSGQSGFQVYTVDVSGTGLETIKYKYVSGSGPYCYLTGVTVSINGGSHIELIDGTAISGNISVTGPETWQDQSGNGNDGVGGVTTTSSGEEPFAGAGGVEFDGNGDYLTAPGPGALGTTGDFTIEAWVYPSGDISSSTGRVVSANLSANSGEGTMIRYRNGGWQFQIGSVPSAIFNTIPATGNQWYHVAMTRTGSSNPVFRGFVNGTLLWQQTDTSNTDVNITQLVVGWGLASQYTNGYISNVRVIDGTSLYTSAFTTPTSALTNVTGTELLTAQGSSIVDASDNNHTITVNGDAAAVSSTTTSSGPTYDVSNGYWNFDSDEDRIVISPSPSTDLSAGDFTISCWFYIPTSVDTTNLYYDLISIGDSTSTQNTWYLKVWRSGIAPGCIYTRMSNVIMLGTDGPLNSFYVGDYYKASGRWTHFTFIEDNGTSYYYINGTRTGSISTPTIQSGQNYIVLGDRENAGNFVPNGLLLSDFSLYQKPLTAAQVYQNYNATKSKYISEASSTAPMIGPGTSASSNLLLSYDFGNRATYDPATNKFSNSSDITGSSWSWLGATPPTITPNAAIAPDGSNTAALMHSGVSIYEGIYNDGDFTISAWVKTVDGSSQSFQQFVYLLSTGGEVLTTTHTATGEWQKFTFSGVATSSFGSPGGKQHRYYPFASTADLYVWAPQVEAGNAALYGNGRYVPTYGTSINLSYGINSLVPTETGGTFGDEPKNQFIDGTVRCNGSFEYITFSNPSVTVSDGSSSTVSWTAELWIKPDAYTGSSDIADLLSDGTYKIELEQGGSDAGKIRYNYSSTVTPFSNIALTAGQWNHVVVKFSPFPAATSVSIQAWINNTFALNTGHAEPLQQIANRSGVGFLGRIAELRIYDKDLSDVERENNWNVTRSKYGL